MSFPDQQELCNNPIADDRSILHAEVNDPIAEDSSILLNGTFSGLRNLVTRHSGLKIRDRRVWDVYF